MDKKVAVVTGSRRGIGLAVLNALALEGYFVVKSDISPDENALNKDIPYIRCDISSQQDREYLIDTIVSTYGRLDVLVNNAGVAPETRTDVLETTEESFDRVLNINLKGTFFMCQLAANKMIELKKLNKRNYSPRIINIASISSYTSSTSRGEYCISKAGISMTTMLFADRLAEFGIPVFEIRPGIILTDMTAGVRLKYEHLIQDGLTPIKRLGRPEDVADCVLAAVSGRLDFATGQVLNADGGFSIRRL
jgi:NAD(P)-dependent dehydrogenase (short-subunit alcohol dehydrogenase family)